MFFLVISFLVLIGLLLYHYFFINLNINKWERDIINYSFDENNKKSSTKVFTNTNLIVTAENIINELNLYFNNIKLNLVRRPILKLNRYYFSTLDFDKILYNIIISSEDVVEIQFQQKVIIIDYKKITYKISEEVTLINPPVYYNGNWYLSMVDFTEIFDLKAVWDYEKEEIRLFETREKFIIEERKKLNRPALIRFEDITAGDEYYNSEVLLKLRIVGDLMYTKSIPFHIAWIPRYKNPPKQVDNDLTKDDNFLNAEFLYTLDYLICKGGIVGIHGYTHQYKNGVSVDDLEFGNDGYSTVDEARDRVLKAVEIAKQLNIPYTFFESPHYNCTKEQEQIFEVYFDYIFEACQGVWNSKPILSPWNMKTIYVPTPLGYVQDNDVESVLNNIKNKKPDSLAALFYHAFKEFEYIKLIDSVDKYPNFEYSKQSMLNQLLDCLEEEKYSLVKITDIKIK